MRYGRNDKRPNPLPTPALPGSGSRDRGKPYSPASQPDLRPAPLYSICPAVGPHFISPHGDCQGRGAGGCPLRPSSLFTFMCGARQPRRAKPPMKRTLIRPSVLTGAPSPLEGEGIRNHRPQNLPPQGGRWRLSRRMRGRLGMGDADSSASPQNDGSEKRCSWQRLVTAARAPACPAPP